MMPWSDARQAEALAGLALAISALPLQAPVDACHVMQPGVARTAQQSKGVTCMPVCESGGKSSAGLAASFGSG